MMNARQSQTVGTDCFVTRGRSVFYGQQFDDSLVKLPTLGTSFAFGVKDGLFFFVVSPLKLVIDSA